MRLKGIFTVEASVIFAFIVLMIGAIIKLDYRLHDGVVNDSCKIQGGIRLYEANSYYYNAATDEIEISRIINSPVIKSEYYGEELSINKKVKNYYDEYKISASNYADSILDDVITVKKNSDIVRKSGRAIKVIGEILDES